MGRRAYSGGLVGNATRCEPVEGLRTAAISDGELLHRRSARPALCRVEQQGQLARSDRSPGATSAMSRTSIWSATAETGRLAGSSTRNVTLLSIGQQRATPAPRAERADRGQRQQRASQRQDRPVGREIIGGRARRGRQQHAVADQLRHDARVPLTETSILRRLARLAQQRDFVDRVMR